MINLQCFITEPVEFQESKNRYNALLANGDIDRCDSLLIDILKLLNQDPDIVTLWSCEGHPELEETGYIMFSVTEQGLLKLLAITDLIHRGQADEFYDVQLSFIKGLAIHDDTKFVNRWILQFPSTIESKDTLIAVLNQSILKILTPH